MNRDRRVTELFESVQPITERDAFRRVIDGESDLNVLADLRDRFWDKRGEKPWQVVEINRSITAKRQAAKTAIRATEGKSATLKYRIENNLVIFFVTTLLAGFGAGLATYKGSLELTNYTTISNESLRSQKEDIEKK